MSLTAPTLTVQQHPFISKPNRTLMVLSIPTFLSLVAEPLTGLVDTGFVARIGASSLAALGVGTAALSSVFWIFNFIAIGTQTSVSQAIGRRENSRAARVTSLGLLVSGLAGLLLIVVGWFLASWIASLLGAEGVVHEQALDYMRIRLLGGPAVILMLTTFGTLRGIQDMRTPLWIALTVNVINILLDAILIPGWGPFPAWEVKGAAAASVIAQTFGAFWAVLVVVRRLGWTRDLKLSEARRLLRVGADLFIRTGSLTFFLLLTTRSATLAGVEAGAAHQAIRQFWIFTALGLDALALTAQSLVGYFVGSDWVRQARRVAGYVCAWGLVMGAGIGIVMGVANHTAAELFVPSSAQSIFFLPWLTAAFIQPLNAIAFVTDGIHWGTADFGYLRNAVLLATLVGSILLVLIDTSTVNALLHIWLATAIWILIRAIFGIVRIWPAVGQAPLRYDAQTAGDLDARIV